MEPLPVVKTKSGALVVEPGSKMRADAHKRRHDVAGVPSSFFSVREVEDWLDARPETIIYADLEDDIYYAFWGEHRISVGKQCFHAAIKCRIIMQSNQHSTLVRKAFVRQRGKK